MYVCMYVCMYACMHACMLLKILLYMHHIKVMLNLNISGVVALETAAF